MKNNTNSLKIAAIADIHVKHTTRGKLADMFSDIEKYADILVMCGDLTDHGLAEEAEILVQELQHCNIPKLAVLGNHDYESNLQEPIKTIFSDNGIIMLEDEVFEQRNVGFTGVKGFAGGFGKYMLTAFGEKEIKTFVNSAMSEVEKLEINLGKISHAKKKVVAMHYSPISETLQGEPLEIYPFLGNSRLEEVINRFSASIVLHGHAHFGTPTGKTTTGIPVYNVASPILQRNGAMYKIFDI